MAAATATVVDHVVKSSVTDVHEKGKDLFLCVTEFAGRRRDSRSSGPSSPSHQLPNSLIRRLLDG